MGLKTRLGYRVRRTVAVAVAMIAGAIALPAQGWWENGHEAITRGVLQDLSGTGDLQRFFAETNDQFVKIPWIEPAGLHFINIDTTATTSGNAGIVSYGKDFTNFRAGTFSFPTSTAAANARYGSGYVGSQGGVPWLSNDTLATLTTKMQTAQTYDDWYRLLPTAGALAHYLEDMHQPMHLTANYNPGGLHQRYEGGQFEDGSVWRYPELIASMTPVSPTYYGNGSGFINALFNRIPTDYDKNVTIRNADSAASVLGTGSVAYYDSLWNQTKDLTKDSVQHAAGTVASAFYTAYVNAGSPAIPQATLYATSAAQNSTITSTGPILDYTNQDFFQVRGSTAGSPCYGVIRFDLSTIKAQYDARFGEGNWLIDDVALATEISSVGTSSLKVYFSPDDTTNIGAGSILRFGDGAAPLSVSLANDIPLLQYAVTSTPQFTINRYDSYTSAPFNWAPLAPDITSGGMATLVFVGNTSTSSATYFGGAGISLEVSAHSVVPEPSMLGLLVGIPIILGLRRNRS